MVTRSDRVRDPAAPRTVVRALESENPLAGRAWGVYKGKAEQSWQPYVDATGVNEQLLAKIALRPKAKWFGAWNPTDKIAGEVRAYVANSQAGDPEALVQMAIFRMRPWEHEACTRLPTTAEQTSYRRWTDQLANGIGTAHTAVILQPDGPFALCAPRGSTLPSRLIGYSAECSVLCPTRASTSTRALPTGRPRGARAGWTPPCASSRRPGSSTPAASR